MPTELETLFKLQEIDERLLRKQRDIETYERRLAERKAAMAALAARIDELGAQRKKLVSDRAFAERRMSDRQELMRERKKRAGNVRNEKEMRASHDEVESLRDEISSVETEVLQLMEQVDAVESQIDGVRKEYRGIEDADHRDVAAEAARIDGLRAELEAIRGERVAVTAHVNAGLLRKYDTVLQRRNGVAVVTVEDGRTCGGCHMQVPPQALIEIRRSASVQVCPNCQRILYVPAE
ncbi:MAG TPA: C4-type zinc ribbon domain-containing protein [Candidatus Binatia bacterium]|nr:C4-type zinc ribbon domain-containing protein [Candidatus Binatia bacterium]